jgi:hypothetical protein
MITYLLAILLIGILRLLTAPLVLLPEATLPTTIDNVINNINNYLGVLNGFIPVYTFLSVLTLILGFETAYFIFRMIKFILSRT